MKVCTCGHAKSAHNRHGGSVCWGEDDGTRRRRCSCQKFLRKAYTSAGVVIVRSAAIQRQRNRPEGSVRAGVRGMQ